MKDKYNSVIYQIWPRSFYDSNNDGIGDIQGIIQKLDYLVELKVTHVWISPLYASPNKDFGYDVSDYYAIHPQFGTMDDLIELIHKADQKGISIIMDLVANHTSTEHPWFKQALEDKKSKYRNYYVFKEGRNNKEPNNWISIFGGSAWTHIEENTYALTLFTPNQADLNWDNKEVRDEVVNIMEYWINLGIAGFRLDVINTISKKEGYPDKNPKKKGYQFADDYIINRPKSIEYAKHMMEDLQNKTQKDIITIGEGMLMSQEAAAKYSNINHPILDMMIHFDIHMLGCGPLGKFDFRKLYYWNINQFKNVINSWQVDMQQNTYWMANYLSNHDQPRHVSRFGNDKKHREVSAKALAVLNMTLKGTPILYQGEEIGMTNASFDKEKWRDYESINAYKVLQEMMHLPAFLAKKVVSKMTRDHARTPMQWSSKENAGFSMVKPWIKVNDNYKHINVEDQQQEKTSVLTFYKTLIQFVRESNINAFSEFESTHMKHKQIFAYYRHDSQRDKTYYVVINLSDKIATFKQNMISTSDRIVVYNYPSKPHISQKMVLRAFESIVVEVIDYES